MKIIKECIVSYREKMKSPDPFVRILARIVMLADYVQGKLSQSEIAKKHKSHRNTVSNVIKVFNNELDDYSRNELRNIEDLDRVTILANFGALDHKSTKPKRHRSMASEEQEEKVVFLHKKLGFGAGRLHTYIERYLSGLDDKEDANNIAILRGLSEAQIQGVYKRRSLKAKTRKTGTSQRTKLYDYDLIGAFSHLHYDTKTITDMRALPLDIYNKFKENKELPVIEWNIMDASSRFRFIAYSHHRSSEFGFEFLLCVLQFIRGSYPCMRDQKIQIGMDNGAEFCMASKKKLADWNRHLLHLNAEAWAYNPYWDIRKNLIERSHKTDDEEFFVPKGLFINDRQSFMDEARKYFLYFNGLRLHTGISMNKMTPLEKLRSKGLKNVEKLLNFPTMILEESMGKIKENTKIIQMMTKLDEKYRWEKNPDPMDIAKIFTTFGSSFKCSNAQNVFTYYQNNTYII